MKRKSLILIFSIVLMAAILFPLSAVAMKPIDTTDLRPMVFIHGYGGTVSSIKTQFLRFASNGYPVNYLRFYEYDTTRYLTDPDYRLQIREEIDVLIAAIMEETDAEQVDLLGHSMGTGVSQGYLNSLPERAANVAHYVNLDGSSASSLPGGVPTLAVWARGSSTRQIVGATNIYFPECSHSQVVGIPETFSAIYEFFNDKAPLTTDIIPEPRGQVRLQGRVVIGTGVPTGPVILEIWEIDGDTGFRVGKRPAAVYEIGGDGAWGPFKAKRGANYEYCVSSEGLRTNHIYSQPPIRSDYWVRLAFYGVTGMDTSENSCLFYVSRNKEWFGDPAFLNSDVLLVNGVNIINDINIPMSTTTNTMVVHDVGSDGISQLDMYAVVQAFALKVDYVVPATNPPDETISFVCFPRGGMGAPQVINVPNWTSANDSIAVGFNEYVQDVYTWDDYVQSIKYETYKRFRGGQ